MLHQFDTILKWALIKWKYSKIYVYISCVVTLAKWPVIKVYVHCGIRKRDTACSSPRPIPMHQITSQQTITLHICAHMTKQIQAHSINKMSLITATSIFLTLLWEFQSIIVPICRILFCCYCSPLLVFSLYSVYQATNHGIRHVNWMTNKIQ
jgi:hypothetical protein